MVVREGSNVTLKCAATGSPTPNITWRREGGEKIMWHSGGEGKTTFYDLCIRELKNSSKLVSLKKSF